MTHRRSFGAIAWRELRTVARTRSYLLLTLGLAVAFVGIVRSGGGVDAGYVPAAVDLLLPLELLTPLVAVAVGYRAFTGDNDDRSVLLTYPVSTPALVAGVFAGRFVGLVGIVGGPLAVVYGLVFRAEGAKASVFATHGGIDSPVLFVRFAALTLLFGAVVLAMAMAVSILLQTGRSVLVAALGVLVAVVAGGDLLALAGLTSGAVGEGLLRTVLAASPNSAYRGLVLELVVGIATDRAGAIDVSAAVASLFGWLAASLVVVAAGVRGRPLSGLRNALYRLRTALFR
jgi:ABC-2 type transport system permease protein